MAVVTTGFFDGVHIGHRHVLETVVSCARERGEESVVVTFWPHPRMVLQQDARDLRLLSSLEEKKALLAAVGIDRVEVLPFTREFAAMTAAEYLQMLHDKFGASLVIMGYDNHIGSDRKTAKELAEEDCPSEIASAPCRPLLHTTAAGPSLMCCHGWHKLPTDTKDSSVHISSTSVRNALMEGEIELANDMLGYDYSLYGVIVAGNRLGRTIGFPTANMKLYEPLKMVPAGGVYAVDVRVLGREYHGMCNIGVRPTVGANNGLTIETNIFDFDEDIYGLDIRIAFRGRIRAEQCFANLDELKEQLERDREFCRKSY